MARSYVPTVVPLFLIEQYPQESKNAHANRLHRVKEDILTHAWQNHQNRRGGIMGIYRVEQARELMTKNFPKCPICKSSKGYEVYGLTINYIRCKSCKAKWRATIEFTRGGHKGINNLTLLESDKDGKTVPLIRKNIPLASGDHSLQKSCELKRNFKLRKRSYFRKFKFLVRRSFRRPLVVNVCVVKF